MLGLAPKSYWDCAPSRQNILVKRPTITSLLMIGPQPQSADRQLRANHKKSIPYTASITSSAKLGKA